MGRSLGHHEKLSSPYPSPFAGAVDVSPESSSGEDYLETAGDEEKEERQGEEGGVGGGGVGGGGVVLRAGGGGVGLGGGVDSEEVEDDASDSDDDEEPDFWSKYGVIDAAALDEDVEIEI